MLEDVGIERAVSYAKTLGVGTVPNVPSLALGSGEVTLASMTAAYPAFANGGSARCADVGVIHEDCHEAFAARRLSPPRDLVAVEVCRLSGALPGEGCRNAASIGPTGAVTFKSMVYTEYFVRGTEPLQTCAIHAADYVPYQEPVFSATAFDGLGGVLGVDPVVASQPPSSRDAGTPVVPPAALPDAALPAPAPPETAPVP
jgi:hypothetical protein